MHVECVQSTRSCMPVMLLTRYNLYPKGLQSCLVICEFLMPHSSSGVKLGLGNSFCLISIHQTDFELSGHVGGNCMHMVC